MLTPHQARQHVTAKPIAPCSGYVWVYGGGNREIRSVLKYLKAVECRQEENAVLWRVPLNGRSFNHLLAITTSAGLVGLVHGEGGCVMELRPHQLERDQGTRHIEALGKPIPKTPKPSLQHILGTREYLRFHKEKVALAFEVFGFDLSIRYADDGAGLTWQQQVALLGEFIGRNMVRTKNTPEYRKWSEAERRLLALEGRE